jgi:hypothetical protein
MGKSASRMKGTWRQRFESRTSWSARSDIPDPLPFAIRKHRLALIREWNRESALVGHQVNEFRKHLRRQSQAVPSRQKFVAAASRAPMERVSQNFVSDQEGSVQTVDGLVSPQVRSLLSFELGREFQFTGLI